MKKANRNKKKRLRGADETGAEPKPRASGIAPTDVVFTGARLTLPPPKQQLTLRLDQDVVAWFRDQGRGYQTLMNAVLRAYVAAQRTPDDHDR